MLLRLIFFSIILEGFRYLIIWYKNSASPELKEELGIVKSYLLILSNFFFKFNFIISFSKLSFSSESIWLLILRSKPDKFIGKSNDFFKLFDANKGS